MALAAQCLAAPAGRALGRVRELSGTVCPRTPLESRLRQTAGEQGYAGSFVAHYLLPLIYPDALTRESQVLLGAGLVLANGLLYALWLARRRRRR